MSSIAKKYAKAIISAARQKNIDKIVMDELKQVSQIINNDQDVTEFFKSPLVSGEIKMKIMQNLIQQVKPTEEVEAFLVLLTDKRRLHYLDDILLSIQQEIDEENGIVRGKIRSSNEISENKIMDIQKIISKTLNKQVFLHQEIDASVIGGVVAHVDGWTFDDTLENHLNRLNEEINRRSL